MLTVSTASSEYGYYTWHIGVDNTHVQLAMWNDEGRFRCRTHERLVRTAVPQRRIPVALQDPLVREASSAAREGLADVAYQWCPPTGSGPTSLASRPAPAVIAAPSAMTGATASMAFDIHKRCWVVYPPWRAMFIPAWALLTSK